MALAESSPARSRRGGSAYPRGTRWATPTPGGPRSERLGALAHEPLGSTQRPIRDVARLAPDSRCETVYRPAEPLDVRLTLGPLLRGRSNPLCRVHPATGDIWATTLLGGGATYVVRQVRDGARVIAWGPGAEAVVAHAPELLGRGDDWSELDVASVPWLAEARRRNPGLRLLRAGAVLEHLAASIIEQKITTLEAHRAWSALHRAFADPAPGPAGLVPAGMTLPLRPEQWRRIPSWAWHRAGVDYSRSTTVLRAAEAAAGLERTLALGRGGEEITRRLRSIRGVGVWTAAETTQRAHGDPDAPSFGDYHLAGHIGYAFRGEAVDDLGMRELLEPWRGHRQRVVRLVFLAGRGKPRRGPRMTIEDHRGR